jgi:hypothetical protein
MLAAARPVVAVPHRGLSTAVKAQQQQQQSQVR